VTIIQSMHEHSAAGSLCLATYMPCAFFKNGSIIMP
jgi:hypothetical protein